MEAWRVLAEGLGGSWDHKVCRPVATCGGGLGALKTRNGAILEGEFRDLSNGGLEAWRLRLDWRPGGWDWRLGGL